MRKNQSKSTTSHAKPILFPAANIKSKPALVGIFLRSYKMSIKLKNELSP